MKLYWKYREERENIEGSWKCRRQKIISNHRETSMKAIMKMWRNSSAKKMKISEMLALALKIAKYSVAKIRLMAKKAKYQLRKLSKAIMANGQWKARWLASAESYLAKAQNSVVSIESCRRRNGAWRKHQPHGVNSWRRIGAAVKQCEIIESINNIAEKQCSYEINEMK